MKLLITENGDVLCMYTERIDLPEIGRITNIKQAATIVFNEDNQRWEVLFEGQKLYEHQSRETAVRWEEDYFSDRINEFYGT